MGKPARRPSLLSLHELGSLFGADLRSLRRLLANLPPDVAAETGRGIERSWALPRVLAHHNQGAIHERLMRVPDLSAAIMAAGGNRARIEALLAAELRALLDVLSWSDLDGPPAGQATH